MANSGAGKALNLKVSNGEDDQCHRTEEMVDNNDTKPCCSRPNTTATATVIPPRRRLREMEKECVDL
ncbi:hypothetical protein L3X38_044742 [Prunus dulcis]|uniref:Uncharacterized protein n=1 Tax=Prunus dulcis TaxID=3755 RepID=A0AAD4V0P7_PRUDU|nr:hypothetical protein L3X38_044742 [Prunus dulcis]